MRLVFFNPNASVHMTDGIAGVARAALPEAEVLGWTNADGPPAIQGAADGAAALPGLMARLPELGTVAADALVIACFDDTGLAELRAAAPCPVIGIGQASFHMAALRGPGFAVMTTLPVSVPVIKANLAAIGLADGALGVFASGIPVLEVEKGHPEVLDALSDRIAALAAQGATSVILGCAGMARHLPVLQARSPVPLVDPVRAGAHLAAALCRTSAAA